MWRLATAAYSFMSARSNRSIASSRHRESRLLLEVRDAAFHEQGDRVGPWHALVGDAPGTIARNRQKSSLLSVRSRHGQRTARSQIERFDPHDLHAADTTGEV